MPMPQINPAIYDAILGMGGESAELDPQIERQQQMAKFLRSQGQMPGLMDAGRRMVAPSKLQYLSALANQGVANQQDRGAMGMQKQQAALRQLQVQEVLKALRGQQQAPPETLLGGMSPGTPQAGA